MILLEEYIDLKIVHYGTLMQFDILKRLSDNGVISFKVLYNNEYVYTLVTRNDPVFFGLELSATDSELLAGIDRELYAKIVVSLYAVFLNEEPS